MTDSFDAAREALARGGLVAYPTEGVFGLGCDPANPDAVARLLGLKGRPESKGLILIADRFEALAPWLAAIDDVTRARIAPTWPGPVTWLLPVAPEVPRAIRGDHDTLAVRVTAHPVAAGLCAAWGGPLVSTSANRAGGAPALDAETVSALFGDALDAVVPGTIGGHAGPTPIRDGRTGRSVRD